MRIIIIAFLCIGCSCRCEWFAHDRAVYDAQHQDWARALERLNASLIDRPDDSSLLYDAGVVAYQSDNYKQAQDYFKRAAHSKSIESPLQKQAYFNLGNTHVALKEYKDAVSAYEQALKIDPSDEHVRHNLKKAQELLKAEEQKKRRNSKNRISKNRIKVSNRIISKIKKINLGKIRIKIKISNSKRDKSKAQISKTSMLIKKMSRKDKTGLAQVMTKNRMELKKKKNNNHQVIQDRKDKNRRNKTAANKSLIRNPAIVKMVPRNQYKMIKGNSKNLNKKQGIKAMIRKMLVNTHPMIMDNLLQIKVSNQDNKILSHTILN